MNYKGYVCCGLLTIASQVAFSGTMGDVKTTDVYAGFYGGGGEVDGTSLSQLATISTANQEVGLNGIGRVNSRSKWIIGGQVGKFYTEKALPNTATWSILPAAELEGYYLGETKVSGWARNATSTNSTDSSFNVSYRTSAGVGIINAVINFNHANSTAWHPYIAGGIGAAAVYINSAKSFVPGEAVNHYNGDDKAASTAFAAQGKAGLVYDFYKTFSLFAEYRYIYLSPTSFVFGSAVAAGHEVTTPWNVKMGAQSYNLGMLGIRYAV